MQVVIEGYDLPGWGSSVLDGFYVGIQIGADAEGLTPAGAEAARWEVDIDVVDGGDRLDFRGPAVHGKKGDRFLYLTWGAVGADNEFEMVQRAKLMLNRIDPELVRSAIALTANVRLSDDDGRPCAARVDPPAIEWQAR